LFQVIWLYNLRHREQGLYLNDMLNLSNRLSHFKNDARFWYAVANYLDTHKIDCGEEPDEHTAYVTIMQKLPRITHFMLAFLQEQAYYGAGFRVVAGVKPLPVKDDSLRLDVDNLIERPMLPSIALYEGALFLNGLFCESNFHYHPTRETPFWIPRGQEYHDTYMTEKDIQDALRSIPGLKQFLIDTLEVTRLTIDEGKEHLANWLILLGISRHVITEISNVTMGKGPFAWPPRARPKVDPIITELVNSVETVDHQIRELLAAVPYDKWHYYENGMLDRVKIDHQYDVPYRQAVCR
jgi:hypothetical protein